MAFEFKARVLLELGAELISSDAVALYELVKNSLDAKVEEVPIEVTIDIKIGMQYSAYQQLITLLDSYELQESLRDKSDFEPTAFNEAVLASLEANTTDWSKEHFWEAYGNPLSISDAKANLEEAYVASNRISIMDNGCGMSKTLLERDYLSVGTPVRFNEKRALIDTMMGGRSRFHYTETNQSLPLGEKGIGRLSAMRLGHLVRVKTKHKNEPKWHRLTMDWRPAFKDPSLDANDPQLDFKPDSSGCNSIEVSSHGTTIFIRDLQSDWSREKIDRMVRDDLAKLADPFAALRANKFIKVKFQDEPIPVSILDREPFKYCDAIVEAKFRYDEDHEPELKIHINYKTLAREKTDSLRGDHLRACVREEFSRKKKNDPKILIDAEIVAHALKHLGPWELKFYWFNRGRIQRSDRELYDTQVKIFLDQWGGGFLVYRDGYRVYPYGERSDDWLDLDRKALAGGAFKLNRAQIVGYLRLSSIANPMLLDQTNREGFRDSLDKEALRRLLRYVVIGYCRSFLEEVERATAPPLQEVVEHVEKRISSSKVAAVTSLKSISMRVPSESKNVATVLQHLEEVSEAWERAKLRISSFDKEIEGYIHLAGVGLMLEFIAHELTRVTQDTLKAVTSGKLAPEVIQAQLKTLEKRVRILDELSIPGRQIRQSERIQPLVTLLTDFHQSKAQRHSILLEMHSSTATADWQEKLEKGQFLQILDNLLSNSFYWLINRLDQTEKGVITIELDRKKREVRVSDNGPGIPPERVESVFAQFFTTKPPREGRGLGLYIAQRLAGENNASLELAGPDPDGMHRTFKLTFGKKSDQ
ncbi:sensor histidine kinase [Acidithiobacillus sp.]|uniref:sensor histidine kinase n=1 Tax=Acidithiobacillus sp. TaxID=1872118 RepID=UPI00258BF8C0|nr:sensor histidine kinase [Acidithiobacillus sp.]